MCSRTSLVLTSGVLLFLAMFSTSDANFTMTEFATSISTCFSKAVNEKFAISLPADQVQQNVANLDFDKINELATGQGVPQDDDSKKFLDDTLYNCFEDFNKLKSYTDEQSIQTLLSYCTCQGLLKTDLTLPNLQCDTIGDHEGPEEQAEFKDLMNVPNFLPTMTEIFVQCTPKVNLFKVKPK